MAWTTEKKDEAVTLYEEQEPTPENSMEVVKEIAEQLEESPNGVRMILTRAGVYIKKASATKTGKSRTSSTGRVSKQVMQDELISALTDAGQPVDEDIINKLSGKAAQYLAGVIKAIN